jgi:hypothetical protein
MTRAAALESCVPVALETNGTVRDALGDLERRGAELVDDLLAERDRRQAARRVAGVHAGLLDVLHDPADVQLGAVVQRVDVDLDRVVEELVDHDGVLGARLGDPGDVVVERGVVVHDLHAAAAEDVRGPHEHRVADLVGDAEGLVA